MKKKYDIGLIVQAVLLEVIYVSAFVYGILK